MSEFVGRVSVDPHDAGYVVWAGNHGVKKFIVLLDGVEQRNVNTADSINGVVVRCKLDSEGNIYAVGDEIALETVTGVVRITIEDVSPVF